MVRVFNTCNWMVGGSNTPLVDITRENKGSHCFSPKKAFQKIFSPKTQNFYYSNGTANTNRGIHVYWYHCEFIWIYIITWLTWEVCEGRGVMETKMRWLWNLTIIIICGSWKNHRVFRFDFLQIHLDLKVFSEVLEHWTIRHIHYIFINGS